MSETRTYFDKFAERIDGLSNIPANEQCLGHFQLAVQSLLSDLLDEIRLIHIAAGLDPR